MWRKSIRKILTFNRKTPKAHRKPPMRFSASDFSTLTLNPSPKREKDFGLEQIERPSLFGEGLG